MKKVLLFLGIFVILLTAAVFALNLVGILDVKDLGLTLLARIPYITTLQELQEENDLLRLKLDIYTQDLEEVLVEKEDLQRERQQKEMELEGKEQEIFRLKNQVAELQQAIIFKEERLDNLVAIYREMDPEDVASILLNLDDMMIIQVLTRLRAANAAAILSHIPSARAATISKDIFDEEGR